MQRLYSMFPSGRPGWALVLIRLSLSVMLMDSVSGPLIRLGSAWTLIAPGVLAACLAAGALTPVVAALSAMLEASTVVLAANPVHAIHVCTLLDAAAIALLGPGAYSLDARLFGRREINLPLE